MVTKRNDPAASSKIAKRGGSGVRVPLGTSSGVSLSSKPPMSAEEQAAEAKAASDAALQAEADALTAAAEADAAEAEAALRNVVPVEVVPPQRLPTYRVLKAFKIHRKGQQLRFAVGKVFNTETFAPDVIKGFIAAGLEVETVK